MLLGRIQRVDESHMRVENVGPSWFVWTHLTRLSYSLVFVHLMYCKISHTVKHLSTLVAFFFGVCMFGNIVVTQRSLTGRDKVAFFAGKQNIWMSMFLMTLQCTNWIALIFAFITIENNISMHSFNMVPQICGPCWVILASLTAETFWSMFWFNMFTEIFSLAFVITSIAIKDFLLFMVVLFMTS